MGYSIVRWPNKEFERNNPSYFQVGKFPEFCSCSHKKTVDKKLNECYYEYRCETCGFTYTIDSSD